MLLLSYVFKYILYKLEANSKLVEESFLIVIEVVTKV